MFKLLEISYVVLIAVSLYGYVLCIRVEDTFLDFQETLPKHILRRKYKYIAAIILSTLMMCFIGWLQIRIGRILDGIVQEKAYPAIRLQDNMPTQVDHNPAPIQFNFDSGKASFYDYNLKNGWSSKGHRVCASRDFPRQTNLKVTNLATGAETTCRVTDFGPSKTLHPDRIIDLSSFAFSELAPLSRGIIQVKVVKIN